MLHARLECPRLAFALLATAMAGGCYSGLGADGDGGGGKADDAPVTGGGAETGDVPVDGCSGTPSVAPRLLHRLTPLQYTNTIRTLFGDPEFEASYVDEQALPTLLGVRQLRTDAEVVLSRQDSWGVDIWGCNVGGAADDACATSFIERFGARAFRRPLTAEERQQFTDLYASAAGQFTFADAMGVVLGAFLNAPEFLYLPESGQPVEGLPDNIRRLTDHEIATRLSYLFWDDMPDEELLSAAANGELVTRDGLRAQAERMIADGRAERMIQDFTWSWLELDGGQLHNALEESEKDPTLFADYGPALQAAMRVEFEAFVREAYFVDGSFDALMTSNRAYVNATMASHYGVAGPADDATWDWVELDPDQRSGMLTRAAFLTVFATAKVQAPVRRGVMVVREILCSPLAPPPPDVDNTPPEGGDGLDQGPLTVRQELDARTQEPLCAGCHRIINPIGYAFEHYDATGRWQDVEVLSGLPVDSTGALESSDVNGPVANALELSAKLAGSAQVRECFADRWLLRATGLGSDTVGECDYDQAVTSFVSTGDIRELLVEVVMTDAFRFLNTADE